MIGELLIHIKLFDDPFFLAATTINNTATQTIRSNRHNHQWSKEVRTGQWTRMDSRLAIPVPAVADMVATIRARAAVMMIVVAMRTAAEVSGWIL